MQVSMIGNIKENVKVWMNDWMSIEMIKSMNEYIEECKYYWMNKPVVVGQKINTVPPLYNLSPRSIFAIWPKLETLIGNVFIFN